MTIRELVDIIRNERQDEVIGEDKILGYVNAIETRLCEEIFLTHEHPPAGVYAFMGMRIPPMLPKNVRWNTSDPLDLHNPPEPYPTKQQDRDDWPPFILHSPGYSDEWSFDDWKDIPLLVKPPYDDVYRAYIQWRIDLAQNDTIDASNSQRVYWQAYQDFAKYWHRTHMPINKTPYRGYKETGI